VFNGTDGWSAGDTINTSIGQGFLEVSPLQMALNTAAVANGGTVYQPRLLHELVDDNRESIQAIDTKRNRRLKIDEAHLNLVRDAMYGVCNRPTGTAFQSPNRETGEMRSKWLLTNPEGEDPIVIAGKSGTAEVGAKLENGLYADAHGWFTCYAPYDTPEIVVTVFLNQGGEGSSYAVPIADRVLRAYFETTGKRERGLVLRKDKEPIRNQFQAPDPNDFKSSGDDNATPTVNDANDDTEN